MGNKNSNEEEFKPGEKVFIPNGNLGNDSNLSGKPIGTGNAQTITTEKGVNIKGEWIEYEKIIEEYSKQAVDSTNNSSLPEGLQNIIKDYFEGLK